MDENLTVPVSSVEEMETVEVLEVSERDFLTTPLDEFTVTEGLLLLIVLILIFRELAKELKEGFYWLLS